MCLEQLTQHLEDKLYACLTKNCAFYSEEQDMQSLYLPKCDDKWDLPQENHIEENKVGIKIHSEYFFPHQRTEKITLTITCWNTFCFPCQLITNKANKWKEN